jgi:hypothetical protein
VEADPACQNCDDCTRDGNCCFDCGLAGKTCPAECQHSRKAKEMKSWPDEVIVKRVEEWILDHSESMPLAWHELRRRIEDDQPPAEQFVRDLTEKISTAVADKIDGRPLGGLSNVSTKDLTDELARREGVIEVPIDAQHPCMDIARRIPTLIGQIGPARILVVID